MKQQTLRVKEPTTEESCWHLLQGDYGSMTAEIRESSKHHSISQRPSVVVLQIKGTVFSKKYKLIKNHNKKKKYLKNKMKEEEFPPPVGGLSSHDFKINSEQMSVFSETKRKASKKCGISRSLRRRVRRPSGSMRFLRFCSRTRVQPTGQTFLTCRVRH